MVISNIMRTKEEIVKNILEIIEEKIQPAVQMDGGRD